MQPPLHAGELPPSSSRQAPERAERPCTASLIAALFAPIAAVRTAIQRGPVVRLPTSTRLATLRPVSGWGAWSRGTSRRSRTPRRRRGRLCLVGTRALHARGKLGRDGNGSARRETTDYAPRGACWPGTRGRRRDRRRRGLVRRLGGDRRIDRLNCCTRPTTGRYAADRGGPADDQPAEDPRRWPGRGGRSESDRLPLLRPARQNLCGDPARPAAAAEAQPAPRRCGGARKAPRARRAAAECYTGASAGAGAVPTPGPSRPAAARAAQRRDIDRVRAAMSRTTVGPHTITLATSSETIRTGREAT